MIQVALVGRALFPTPPPTLGAIGRSLIRGAISGAAGGGSPR